MASSGELLREAAHAGDKARLEAILEAIPEHERSRALNARDNSGRTALMISIKNRHDNVAIFLIDRGSNINASDRDGRNALMYSIWKCRISVFRRLIDSNDIKVAARDKRSRNAIHHLASDHDRAEKNLASQKPDDYLPAYDDEILDVLRRRGVDPNASDGFGKTCLHHAASTGNNRLVQRLLRPGTMNNDALIVKDSMDRYPVHLAAERNNFETFKTLMDVNRDIKKPHIDDHISGGWTALHLACRNAGTKIDFVQSLIEDYHADATKKTWDGQSAVHVAAGVGNYPIIEYLLKKFKIKLSQRDPFGTSPLFHAAKKGYSDKDIIKLFAPWGEYVEIEKDAEEAAHLSMAKVIDFNLDPDEEYPMNDPMPKETEWKYTRKELSVYDLIYAEDKDETGEPAYSCLRPKAWESSKHSKGFRWIHLPANNISWCRDLTSKHFIENVLHGVHVHGPGDLTKSFLHYERRGKKLHSRYMTPICENVRNFQRFGGSAPHDHPLLRTDSLETPKKTSNDDQVIFRKVPAEKAGGILFEEPETEDGDHFSRSATSINSMYLFMPFLHYETFKDLVDMQCVAEKLHPGDFEWAPELKARLSSQPGSHAANEALFKAHLAPENPSLHIRRTLDQFFYQNIDTHYRDTDQVMERYQRTARGRTEQFPADDDKLLMVDQLWMWVLSKDLVLTAFPTQWKPTQPDRLNVFNGILQSIDSTDSTRVFSVYELATAIAGYCYGTLDRHAIDEKDYQVLDTYKQSIGSAMARETEYFDIFKRQVFGPAASQKAANNANTKNSVKEDGSGDTDALPNTTSEISLLTEVKDIIDELDILSLLLDYQSQVRKGMEESFKSIPSGTGAPQKALKECQDHQRLIDRPLNEITRMQDQVKRIRDSIIASLDLKQKHASTIQADNAARQAKEATKVAENTSEQMEETARQGRTLMVFTLVTVVFLPLSFIAAFFTMSISTFPRNDGNIELPIHYVANYVFGIGTPVAAFLVFIALSAETTANIVKKFRKILPFFSHGDKTKPVEPSCGTKRVPTDPEQRPNPGMEALGMFIRRLRPPDLENGIARDREPPQESRPLNPLSRIISRTRAPAAAIVPEVPQSISQRLSPNGSSSKVASSSALHVQEIRR